MRRERRRRRFRVWLLICLGAAALLTVRTTAATHPSPERPTVDAPPLELEAVEETSRLGMVVTGSPEASAVGASVLAEGGNAVDAAVAAAFAIGVAEPAQSGLGGQTYILVRLADGRVTAIDGSALAPLVVDRAELKRLAETHQRYGHQLAATPATVAALAYALERYGTRAFADMIAPAIELAEAGNPWTAFHRIITDHYLDRVRESEYLAGLYLEDGIELYGLERRFCDADLARTLRRLAERGAGDFYHGDIAHDIVRDMASHRGFVSAADLAAMRVVEREPLRGSYRGYEVLSFPEPCAGGAVIEELHILERFPASLLRADSLDGIHLALEAGRLAMRDENEVRSLVAAASQHLVSKQHAARRAAMIRFDRALSDSEVEGGSEGSWRDRDTTHISVADRYGNVVALTQTLGRGYGAAVAAPELGFPYNGILEGFEVERTTSRFYLLPLRPIFTSIAPTIVTREGRPFLVLGSAGSSRIAPSIVAVIVNVIDRGLDLAPAQSAPRALWSGSEERALLVELAPPISPATVHALAGRGFSGITAIEFPSVGTDLSRSGGVNAVLVGDDGTLVGVCDPRRGGLAAGVCPAPLPGHPVAPVGREAAGEVRGGP